MNGHISDELPRLLSGEADRDAVLDAAAHLRGCADCQQELVAAVVAHASLTSAHRFAPEVVGRAQAPRTTAEPAPAPLPDLSAVFAQVREEVDSSRPRSRRPLYAVAAVAAGLIVGTGGTVLVSQLDHGSSPTARTVALSAFGDGRTPAQAQIIGNGQLKVDAASLPSLDPTHRYEVWLTNSGRTQMQPVGWIGADGKADLTVPGNLLHTYSDIEVSVQQVDSTSYVYSGTSVLRGSYTT